MAPIFIPRPHQGGLCKIIKQIESDLNQVGLRRVKVVEEGGQTLSSQLVRSNPLGDKTCRRENCQVCLFKGGKGQCKLRSACYVNTCLICKQRGLNIKYWGETSKSTYERAKTHMGEARKQHQTSHIVQHLREFHKGETVNLRGKLSI